MSIGLFIEQETIVSQVRNGDVFVPFKTFVCGYCGEHVPESSPHIDVDKGTSCCDCAYINGIISEEEYLKTECFWVGTNAHADIVDGKVILAFGKRRKCSPIDRRTTPEYKQWRADVFSRDSFTCQSCNKVGGELNAHHIKSYKDHKKLRVVLENGVTLCVTCHRAEHAKN